MPWLKRIIKSTYKRGVPWRKQFKSNRPNRPVIREVENQPIYLYQMTVSGYFVYLARIGSSYRYRATHPEGMLFEMDMSRVLSTTQVGALIRVMEELAREAQS